MVEPISYIRKKKWVLWIISNILVHLLTKLSMNLECELKKCVREEIGETDESDEYFEVLLCKLKQKLEKEDKTDIII